MKRVLVSKGDRFPAAIKSVLGNGISRVAAWRDHCMYLVGWNCGFEGVVRALV